MEAVTFKAGDTWSVHCKCTVRWNMTCTQINKYKKVQIKNPFKF